MNIEEKEVTRQLPVKLTSEEQQQFIQKTYALRRQVKEERAAKAEAVKEHNRRIREFQKELEETEDLLAAGEQEKACECKESWNYSAGMVITTRNDTGEMVEERPMTDDERQAGLFVKAAD